MATAKQLHRSQLPVMTVTRTPMLLLPWMWPMLK